MTKQKQKRRDAPYRRLEILDAEGLASVVQWIRHEAHRHSIELPTDAPTLSKLARERFREISEMNFSRIFDFVERLQRIHQKAGRADDAEAAMTMLDALRNCVMSPIALDVVWPGYFEWLAERPMRFAYREGSSTRLTHGVARRVSHDEDVDETFTWQAPTVSDPDTNEAVEFWGPPARRMRALMQCVDRIRAVASDEVAHFEKSCASRGHTARRVQLSLVRIAEPLVEHLEAGGIERGHAEFDEKELRQYVGAALRAERLVLRRASDDRRAQMIAPMTF